MRITNFLFSSHLDEGEKILDVCHRHPLILKISSFKVVSLGILLPLFFYFIFPEWWFAFVIWGGIGFIGFMYHFVDCYFDAWLLTNVGVIDIERNGLFDRTSTRVDYHMIEGISYTVKGFLQTIFNYGDITVDKLGAQTSVILRDATSPKRVERKVIGYQEKYVRDRSIRDHNALKNMLSEMIAYHVQNKKINPNQD